MISKETYDKIQEYKETGLSILKATQKLGISYNTTYKWWNKTDEEFTSFQKEHDLCWIITGSTSLNSSSCALSSTTR